MSMNGGAVTTQGLTISDGAINLSRKTPPERTKVGKSWRLFALIEDFLRKITHEVGEKRLFLEQTR